MVEVRGSRLCGVPSERGFLFPGDSQGLHPGLVCDAPSAPLTDGVGSVLDWEVYFPLAGSAGPGFHNWPQATSLKTRLRNRFSASGPMSKRRSERRSAPRPGSATHGYKRTGSETAAQAGRRRCSRVRWPRFSQLAFGPHPSRHSSETASSHPVPCQKDVRRSVRRRDRGQRPTATKDPKTKQLRR